MSARQLSNSRVLLSRGANAPKPSNVRIVDGEETMEEVCEKKNDYFFFEKNLFFLIILLCCFSSGSQRLGVSAEGGD